jgi:hypothetical protein
MATDATFDEPALVFAAPDYPEPALELRVNFGVFAGREATPAELETLGHELLSRFESVTIVSERHYEIGSDAEAAVHQVRIGIPVEAIPEEQELSELRGRLLEVTERWARLCIDNRHEEIVEA